MTASTIIFWALLTAAILAAVGTAAVITERNRGNFFALLAGAALGAAITWLAWATCQ